MPWVTINGEHVLLGEDEGIASVHDATEIVRMQAFGESPARIKKYMTENGINSVIGYHVTNTEAVDEIKGAGIRMSSQDNRPDAAYFFLDKSDAISNANNLGYGHKGSDYSVVSIKIPKNDVINIRDDGLYNGTFSNSYSAARLFRDIPPQWIHNIETISKK
jgi:hypothetical protein